jgi:hypothetical protein
LAQLERPGPAEEQPALPPAGQAQTSQLLAAALQQAAQASRVLRPQAERQAPQGRAEPQPAWAQQVPMPSWPE